MRYCLLAIALLLVGCAPVGTRYVSTQSASILAVEEPTGEQVRVFFVPGSPFLVERSEYISTPPDYMEMVARYMEGAK